MHEVVCGVYFTAIHMASIEVLILLVTQYQLHCAAFGLCF